VQIILILVKLKFAEKFAGFLRILVLRTKTKRFENKRTNLQQKKIHELKPKKRELTGTKIIFKLNINLTLTL
jgi:hypothetical protein